MARAAGVADYSPCPVEVVADEMATARAMGARMLCLGAPDYPAALAGMPDAPPVLWLRGQGAWLDRPMVALVGARNASSLGVRMARRLAEGLGEAGFTVVSGLARGIDWLSSSSKARPRPRRSTSIWAPISRCWPLMAMCATCRPRMARSIPSRISRMDLGGCGGVEKACPRDCRGAEDR
jgi:hypothetical protein